MWQVVDVIGLERENMIQGGPYLDQADDRCLLVYSGIHYDAITLSPLPSAPLSFHTTVFPVSDDTIVSTAITLVSNLKQRHYYTDTANFDLRCGICKIGLKGEKGAREHAMSTGREYLHHRS